MGLTKAAPVPKSGAGGDASGARLNWADIAVSSEKMTSRSLAGQERSEPSGELGLSRQRVVASAWHWIVGSHFCASLG